jgi:hypothetical protein
MLTFLKNIIRFFYRLKNIIGIQNECFTPGHFYSPIVSINLVQKRESIIWQPFNNSVPEIDLASENQIKLLESFSEFYKDLAFAHEKDVNRYYFDNDFFGYTDAVMLFSVIRFFKPKKIFEAGSGFSSALMLDIREKFSLNMELNFIEPYPKRLNSLLKKTDYQNINIYQIAIQNFEMNKFEDLESGDIFFVDSTHVSKTGSDVNHILFNILPKLKKGVIIHFHDIFYPFEYPKSWVFQGRSWNENYILRAFLMNNKNYEILIFADYLHKVHPEAFEKMPLCYKNKGGSLWIRKKA